MPLAANAKHLLKRDVWPLDCLKRLRHDHDVEAFILEHTQVVVIEILFDHIDTALDASTDIGGGLFRGHSQSSCDV